MYQRGEIYYIGRNAIEPTGSEQYSGRPAVIVSNNVCNECSPVLEAVYLTTREKKAMPTHVKINSCKFPSTALCEQISSIAVERIGDYIATCTEEEMDGIDNAMAISLALGKHIYDGADKAPTVPLKSKMEPDDKKQEYEKKLVELRTTGELYKKMYENLIEMLIKEKDIS